MNSQRSWSVVLGVAAGARTFFAMSVCAQRGVYHDGAAVRTLQHRAY